MVNVPDEEVRFIMGLIHAVIHSANTECLLCPKENGRNNGKLLRVSTKEVGMT